MIKETKERTDLGHEKSEIQSKILDFVSLKKRDPIQILCTAVWIFLSYISNTKSWNSDLALGVRYDRLNTLTEPDRTRSIPIHLNRFHSTLLIEINHYQ